MKTFPTLIIVADRGRLIAFHREEGSAMTVIDTLNIAEGREKLSDLVTDNAGRFPNTGSPQKEGGSAERMPLLAELEMRCFAKIAGRITELCELHNPQTWGFAAPSEINGAILDGLNPRWKDRLVRNLPKDLINLPANEILERFQTAAELVRE